ncbi:WXG100 family type VII secretion target [Nonomuraea roseola]|uniref:WXG100 family type VII secretion target n=1 Tax=Nonomuraea roseola TaxID=46179 RepID=A0ABV5PQI3_9ACTN
MAFPSDDVKMSFDDRVRVNFSSMENATGDLSRILSQFDTITDELMKDLRIILGDSDGADGPEKDAWGGGAKTFFEEKKRKWDAEAAIMRQELAAAGIHVNTANDNYQAAERANVKMWLQS